MLPDNLNTVTPEYLQRLCDDACPESGSLDFKRKLPGRGDRDKSELLKDICAFANTDGGDLVYGIDESKGAADSIVPIRQEDEAHDDAKRRIMQVLDAGLDPRVPGISIQHVEVNEGYVLLIRVPASYDGPHCFRTNPPNRRFVLRNNTGITDMTYSQIRTAFDRTSTLVQQAQEFVKHRHELISDYKTPVILNKGPVMTLHLVPLAGLAGRRSVDLREVNNTAVTEFQENEFFVGKGKFNFDGLTLSPPDQGKGAIGYTHVYRDGSLEASLVVGREIDTSGSGPVRKFVPDRRISQFVRSRSSRFLSKAQEWGFTGPAILNVGILNVEGYEMGVDVGFYDDNAAIADRKQFVPPYSWIENIGTTNVDAAIRPTLDIIWQAFGHDRCNHFDEQTGEYKWT